MPNTSSAEKALRQSDRRRVRNIRQKRGLKDVLKKLDRAISQKNKTEAEKLIPAVQKALDKASKRNLVTRNTASRKKSRIVKRVRALS